ncbi:MAG TPA: tetratricopeptide repeat protein [Fimbriimonas sp.]|nr:tetratricopeptide repeat protein [Fimbriimonas sp.]
MGGIRHPAADLARQAVVNREYKRAGELIDSALDMDPGNADFICELAILHVLRGHEDEAFELVPLASEGFRAEHLLRGLSNHYYCRVQQNEYDFDAVKRLHLLDAFDVHHAEDVGVKVSACLIVKNEENNLDRCLASLKGMVDEIVVVDTGSTDSTVEIAQKYNAITDTFIWCDDFAAARNHALSLATGNWGLWIDADEELAPESFHAIKRAIVRPQFGGFDIEIVNYVEDRQDGNEVRHCPTRLFRLIPGVRFSGRIHEQVTPSLEDLDLPWTRLEGAKIHHYGYRPEEMERKGKLDRTINMLEREVRDNARDPFQWFNLANAYLVGGRFAEAEHAAARCVKLVPPQAPYASHAYYILMQASSGAGDYDSAIKAGIEAETKGVGDLLTSFEKCRALFNANRPQEALEECDRLMLMQWQPGSSGDYSIFTHKKLVLRGQILATLGRFDEALVVLNDALEVDPNYSVALFSRGAVLERLGRLSEALDAFTRAAYDKASFNQAMKGCGRALAAVGRPVEAATAFRKAWERAPEDIEAWVSWTGACEATGDVRAVLETFEAHAAIYEPTANILIDWGRALEAAGEFERSLNCFADAIRKEPACANAYFNCGDLLYRMGAVTDAAHLYQAGLKIDPGHADGWFTLGNALAKSGLTSNAIQAYKEALARNPRHERAAHNLTVLEQEALPAA